MGRSRKDHTEDLKRHVGMCLGDTGGGSETYKGSGRTERPFDRLRTSVGKGIPEEFTPDKRESTRSKVNRTLSPSTGGKARRYLGVGKTLLTVIRCGTEKQCQEKSREGVSDS